VLKYFTTIIFDANFTAPFFRFIMHEYGERT
jgi:hypothetical protein